MSRSCSASALRCRSASDIVALLSGLAIERAAVVGLRIGGLVATELATSGDGSGPSGWWRTTVEPLTEADRDRRLRLADAADARAWFRLSTRWLMGSSDPIVRSRSRSRCGELVLELVAFATVALTSDRTLPRAAVSLWRGLSGGEGSRAAASMFLGSIQGPRKRYGRDRCGLARRDPRPRRRGRGPR
jgi:pimeloyl-ACP methyl ester carboxylesterase